VQLHATLLVWPGCVKLILDDVPGRVEKADANRKRSRCAPAEGDIQDTGACRTDGPGADSMTGELDRRGQVDPARPVASPQPQRRLPVLDRHCDAVEQLVNHALWHLHLRLGRDQLVLQAARVLLRLGVVGEQQIARLAPTDRLAAMNTKEYLFIAALELLRPDPRGEVLREIWRQVVAPLPPRQVAVRRREDVASVLDLLLVVQGRVAEVVPGDDAALEDQLVALELHQLASPRGVLF